MEITRLTDSEIANNTERLFVHTPDGRRQFCITINSHGAAAIFAGDFLYKTAQMVSSRLAHDDVLAIDFPNARYLVSQSDFSRGAVQKWLLKAERSSGSYTVTTVSLYDTVPHDKEE